VCGEREAPSDASWTSYGSSPRVRGTHGLLRLARGAVRFIPACAGNADPRALARYGKSVHPRVCGERGGRIRLSGPCGGSSPRVRGTLGGGGGAHGGLRFIPACAGNAAIRWRGSPSGSVHPRVCGERWWTASVSAPLLGSSPRVRGTQAPAATT